jgi:hypothetical protein
MSILWAGGEEIDFPAGSSPQHDLPAYRSGYARYALYPPDDATIRTNPISIPLSFWLSMRLRPWGAVRDSYRAVWGVWKSGTNYGLGVSLRESDHNVQLVTVNGTTVSVLATGTLPNLDGQLDKCDLQVTNYGAEAAVEIFLNGVSGLTFAGDVRPHSSVTAFDQIASYRKAGSPSYNGSEIILADDDTRLFSLVSLYPNGAGAANTFTSGGYGDVDEATLSDADTLFSATAGQAVQLALSDLPTGNFIVKGVKLTARMSDGVGGMAMKMGVRTNGAIHVGDPIALVGAWETKEALLSQNPETLNVFTPTEVNALQLAFESAAA